MDKTSAFEFWKKKLKSAKYVIAPMVDQSELPWRLLSRKYGAELCYTPMFHASVFIRDPNYRTEALQSCAEDHPLITQFCANDPETLLKAAQYVETFCEAVDLNLGCPQVIARKGHYGAFLQDEWDLIHKMVSLCHSKLKIPITCKIRVFESIEKTVEYAKMLENAGCQLLTVHGRTREQKGALTGIADWAHIKAVKENVKIPVFGNGNIQYLQDVHRCIKETGVDGVMSAEGNLHNPAIFRGIDPPVWQMAEEYLEFVEKYPCSISYVRGHLFKMLHHALVVHNDVREMVGVGKTVGCFKEAVEKLKIKCQVDVERYKVCPDDFVSDKTLPYWICQPYVRLNPEERKKNENRERRENQKRHIQMRILAEEFVGLSNNKIKKMMKKPNRCFDPEKRVPFEICQQCPNTKGQKCDFSLCKVCCKLKTKQDILDCEGHNFMVRSRSNGGLIENLKPQRVSVGDDVNNLAISTSTAIQKVTIDSHMQKISNGTDLVVIGDSTTRDTTHESDLLGIKSNS